MMRTLTSFRPVLGCDKVSLELRSCERGGRAATPCRLRNFRSLDLKMADYQSAA
jgi:hypothetical protein